MTHRLNLSDDDMVHIHDVIWEAADISLPDNLLAETISACPVNILDDAKMWGWSDTVVRDNLFLWVVDSMKK